MNAPADPVAKPAIFSLRQLALAALFGLAYWLLRRYCLSLPVAASAISYVWLPDGLALGALLCTRVRQWPPFVLAMLAIGLLDSSRAFAPALLAIGLNIFEPALIAFVVTRFLGVPPRIDSVKGVVALFLCTIALMAGATLLSSGIDWFVQRGHYWEVWRVWFVSDTLGMLLIAPLIVAWAAGWPSPRTGGGWRALEIGFAFGGLVIATHLAYSIDDPLGRGATLVSFTLPFLMWSALRFRMRGATLAMTVYSMQSFWYTANGLGHFARNFPDPHASVVALQTYLVILIVVVLLSAALTADRYGAFTESVELRRRFESVLAASHSLMYEVDHGSRSFTWGGNVGEVLGIAPENVPDVPRWIERVHPDDRHLLEGLRERFASGEVNALEREYRLRRDDGSYLWVSVTAYGFAGGERTGKPGSGPLAPLETRVVGFIRDISERKRADEERRALEERLRQAQKLEAIGRFADGIAHDFNNILSAILGYGELAKGKAPAGSDIRRYLETIHVAGERGKALVAQILTFSRAKPAERRPVLFAELIDEVVLQVQGSLPKGITIALSNEYRGAVVLGEAIQLHQLAMNLCTNAIQAMAAGGVVKLSVRAQSIQAERAAFLGKLQPGPYVELEVQDSGAGIDKETLAKIFEPFFTTKPAGAGTGLGLALVQSIALEHGGALEVDSAPGRGTRISVYLPEFAIPPHDSHASRAAAEPGRDLPRGSGQTVLVIDDEPALAALAQELLAELGYEALAYSSSVEALDAYAKEPERFDAILTDEVMPQLTGTQLAARVRQTRSAVPILVITGYGGPGFEIRAHEAGVSRVLRKPYQKRELAEALAAVLAVPG